MISRSKKLVVGLSGGIACGKSSALKIFRELGCDGISTDRITSGILENNDSVKRSIGDKWGRDVFINNQIDKPKIAEIIFNSVPERIWLEELLHPLVRKVWTSRVKASNKTTVVVEIPLLFEKSLQNFFEITVCLISEKNIQLQRLHDRGLTNVQSNARIESQMRLTEKMQLADIVMLGDNSLSFLKQQIDYFLASVT
jgi:dephospho-CoA kinase